MLIAFSRRKFQSSSVNFFIGQTACRNSWPITLINGGIGIRTVRSVRVVVRAIASRGTCSYTRDPQWKATRIDVKV